MSKLVSCAHCESFLPHTSTACPNCGETRGRAKLPLPLKGALAVGAGAVLAMTLSACYGAPNDPYYDSGADIQDSGSDSGGEDAGDDDSGPGADSGS